MKPDHPYPFKPLNILQAYEPPNVMSTRFERARQVSGRAVLALHAPVPFAVARFSLHGGRMSRLEQLKLHERRMLNDMGVFGWAWVGGCSSNRRKPKITLPAPFTPKASSHPGLDPPTTPTKWEIAIV